MELAPGSRPSRGFVCGKKGEQDGGTAHRGPLPLSPVLEKCQHQPPSVQCKNVGAIVPLSLSAHTSFPSYRQRYCSQHPPSLGHPLDHFGISFPCFPTHDASGPFSNIPVHTHLFPPQGQSLQHLVLLLSSLAGQAGPHPPEGAGSWPSLAGGGLFPHPWPWPHCPYQDVVLRNGDVAGMDGQPDTLLHLGGKPAGLSRPLTPLLPGAPGWER